MQLVQFANFKAGGPAIAVAAGLLSFALHAPCADLSTGVEGDVRHAGNVGYAHAAPDQISDTSIDAKLSLAALWVFEHGLGLSVSGDLRSEWFDRVAALRSATLESAVSFRKKWGLGALAPWARAGVAIGRSQFEDHLRSATHYRTFIGIGRRFDTRLNLWAQYDYEQQRAAEPAEDEERPGIATDVFTQSSHSLTGNAQYLLSERLSMDVNVLVRRGDVASTVRSSPGLYFASRAIVEDPAFGDEFYAYKLTATTYGLRVGGQYALGEHHLLGAGVQRIETRARGGYNYTDTVPQLSWSYRF